MKKNLFIFSIVTLITCVSLSANFGLKPAELTNLHKNNFPDLGGLAPGIVQTFVAAFKATKGKDKYNYMYYVGRGLLPPPGGVVHVAAPAPVGNPGMGFRPGVVTAGMNSNAFDQLVRAHLAQIGVPARLGYNMIVGRQFFKDHNSYPQDRAAFTAYRDQTVSALVKDLAPIVDSGFLPNVPALPVIKALLLGTKGTPTPGTTLSARENELANTSAKQGYVGLVLDVLGRSYSSAISKRYDIDAVEAKIKNDLATWTRLVQALNLKPGEVIAEDLATSAVKFYSEALKLRTDRFLASLQTESSYQNFLRVKGQKGNNFMPPESVVLSFDGRKKAEFTEQLAYALFAKYQENPATFITDLKKATYGVYGGRTLVEEGRRAESLIKLYKAQSTGRHGKRIRAALIFFFSKMQEGSPLFEFAKANLKATMQDKGSNREYKDTNLEGMMLVVGRLCQLNYRKTIMPRVRGVAPTGPATVAAARADDKVDAAEELRRARAAAGGLTFQQLRDRMSGRIPVGAPPPI